VSGLLHSTQVPAGVPLYRITSLNQWTKSKSQHKLVVDGRGAFKNPNGGRYNHQGVVTVYLTESIGTCLAERMYYFHREYLQALDGLHGAYGVVPPFLKTFVIWEIEFANSIADVADVNVGNAGHFQMYPAMLRNPSHDYEHLKRARGAVQMQGYEGIRAPSSRCLNQGAALALFNDQSGNLTSITPYRIDFSLVQPNGVAFTNHASQELDFQSGRVQAFGNPLPAALQPYANPQVVDFNH
jgi:hypothetical protein